MLLVDLKDYVQAQESISLPDLANHFHLPFSVIEDMMGTWIKKGFIEKQTGNTDDLPPCAESTDCPRCKLKKDPQSLISFKYKK